MRFNVPLVLAVAGLAQATPVTNNDLVKRDAAAVVDAVTTISDATVELNTTVSSYGGGLLGTGTALKIQIQAIGLSNDIKDAISTTQESKNFTTDGSMAVSEAFLDLQPTIASSLDTFVRKKPEIDTGLLGIGSLAFLVKANLENLRDLAGQLGEEVTAKLAPPYNELAPTILQQITDKFDKTIAVYS
ncbi:cell wall mannoprotein 1 family protein [Aspergillus lucknowensis]|uniref:Hydrophobic surface binding protein A-domain-containing protein n=1 Tax=Aspergillus lucknowensis TaxID=176173 RepID=A0ABR4LDM3_9EURO